MDFIDALPFCKIIDILLVKLPHLRHDSTPEWKFKMTATCIDIDMRVLTVM